MIEHDLLRIVGVCVSMATLGLVMGLSPTLYAVELRLLTRTPRARPAVLGLCAGMAVGATTLALAFQAIDPDSIEAVLEGRVERVLVRRGVDLLAGAVFLAAGAALGWRARRRPRRAAEPDRAGEPVVVARPGRMALVGLSSTVVSLSSIPTMYLTARSVRAVSEDDMLRAAAYAVFLLALLGPYLLLALLWSRVAGLERAAGSLHAWIAGRDPRPWAAGALVLVGAGFVIAGLRAEP